MSGLDGSFKCCTPAMLQCKIPLACIERKGLVGKKVRVRTCRHCYLGLRASGLACRLRSLDGSALATVTLYGAY